MTRKYSSRSKVPLLVTNHINYLSVDGVYIPFTNIRYPKSVFFIISNEFCERFSYYGMKTVLALYLTSYLKYDTDTSTELYHVFTMLCYFFPLFGAIIADSFLGKFRTIFYLSIIYALGNIVLSFGAVPILPIPHRVISLLGLLFIAVGTGGIKPCVSSFGGDQFLLPQQSLQLQQFFSFFYFSINAGSMISTFLTPLLRNDVKCFGENNCFSLAFGVPAILMITSVVIFVSGKQLYRIKKPEENIIVTFANCILRAMKNKISGKNDAEKRTHWLEYANDKYTKEQISDFQAVLNVLYLFIPVPLFWALFDQQGSRWTFQATNMDGRIFGFTLKPDQMQVVNPLMILAFIPVFELYVYPALRIIGVKRPLQKLVIGGWLAAMSFVISAMVESRVQISYGVLPVSGEAQLRIFNSLDCGVTLNPSVENMSYIPPLSTLELLHINSQGSSRLNTTFGVDPSCPYTLKEVESSLAISEEKIVSYFVSHTPTDLSILRPTQFEHLTKDGDGEAKIRVFYGSASEDTQFITLRSANDLQKAPVFSALVSNNTESEFVLIPPGSYNLISNSATILSNVIINPGEIDTIILSQNSNHTTARLVNMVPSNSVHMLWQLPQIIMITAGEIMFSITGLEFSFTQAPPSMKSVLSAAWLLTVAFGNLIVVIVSELKFFNSQVYEFLLFAGLMMVDMLFLIVLCVRYNYVNYTSDSREDTPELRRDSLNPGVSQLTVISTVQD